MCGLILFRKVKWFVKAICVFLIGSLEQQPPFLSRLFRLDLSVCSRFFAIPRQKLIASLLPSDLETWPDLLIGIVAKMVGPFIFSVKALMLSAKIKPKHMTKGVTNNV